MRSESDPLRAGPSAPGTNVSVSTARGITARRTVTTCARPLVLLLLLLLVSNLFFVAPGDHRESPSRPTHATPVMRRGTGERTARRPSRASDHDNDKYLCTLQSSSMPIEHSEPDVLCNMTVDHSDLTSEQSLSCMLRLSYEYDVSAHGSNVKGRLKTRTMFWKDIKASPFVLDILENGYSIPFISIPISKFNRNNKSARDNLDFETEAVSELLEKGCVVEASIRPHVINPLSVAINSSGKKRLILDLHEVNLHVMHYFHKGDFMFKFDLKSGYHHIDIAEWCQTFLGFAWQERFYVFTVLPFGLSSAPYIFTKCLRPMVRFWREHGVNIVLYLDDGWCSNRSLESCSRDAQFVYDSLKRAGFVVSMEKSILEPTTSLNWLGLIWDSGDHSILFSRKTHFGFDGLH